MPCLGAFPGEWRYEQLPEGLDYSLRIMGSEHTASFSYPFLPFFSFFLARPTLQGSAQICLPCFSIVSVPLAVQSEESASSCSSLSIVSYRQHYPGIISEMACMGSSKR